MFNIRKADRGEETEIMNLVKSVLSDYGLKTDPITDQDISDLEQDYFNINGWFAVLENNSKIIGGSRKNAQNIGVKNKRSKKNDK